VIDAGPLEIVRRYSYASVPTVKRFSQSKAFIRGLMGPFGSGKSSGCVMELVKLASRQPLIDGKRRARFACIRNTYGQLADTTIKTFLYWLPDGVFGTFNKGDHVYHLNNLDDLDVEVLFRALDRPEHVANLLSLELSAAWVNEAREIPWAVIKALKGRVDRYPPREAGGCVDPGIIMDTNPPDDTSWWYRLFEERRIDDDEAPASVEIFKQPSGRSAEAENLPNLSAAYYANLAAGSDSDFIRVYVDGQYGYVKEGKPVYTDYNDAMHCAEVEPTPGVIIKRGWDFGLTPACVFTQVLPDGRWIVFEELCGDDIGITTFADTVLQLCSERWPAFHFEDYGDPAGKQRSAMTADKDEKTCFDILAGKGIRIEPGEQNVTIRLESVRKPLNTLREGKPQFQISPRCTMLRKGFAGRYQYRRVKIAGSAERYHDEPEKNEYSHCFPAGTLVSTPKGPIEIESLRIGELVCTPVGPRRVLATMNRDAAQLMRLRTASGHQLLCTPDHPIWTPNGFVRADSLECGTILGTERPWADQQSTQFKNSTASAITGSHPATTRRTTASTCIGTFGATTMARLRQAFRCITQTTIEATTPSITSICSPADSTPPYTGKFSTLNAQNGLTSIWRGFGSWLRRGIARKLAGNGTLNMPGAWLNHFPWTNTFAFAAVILMPFGAVPASAAFAPRIASRRPDERAESMTRAGHVSAAPSFGSIDTLAPSPAGDWLVERCYEPIAPPTRVYDLTVEGAHVFYANGILVHNCHDALQYVATKVFGSAVRGREQNEREFMAPLEQLYPEWAKEQKRGAV
jgi:hypothetical protein